MKALAEMLGLFVCNKYLFFYFIKMKTKIVR